MKKRLLKRLPRAQEHPSRGTPPTTRPEGEEDGELSTGGDERGERLQKVLAAAGLASRRECEEYIAAGRVKVDGRVVTELGVRVQPLEQQIAVDDEPIRIERKQYILVHKPSGCLCTNHDPSGRTRVIDLIPTLQSRLFTVGRLDEHTEGLVLVTNDGDLAHRLAHPRFQVERVYRVLVAGLPSSQVLEQLRQGLYFTEGKFWVHDVRRLKTHGESTVLEVTMREGQNREIRRLLARVGHKVLALQRIAFGPLKLGSLGIGEWRSLSATEVRLLERFTRGEQLPERRPVKRPPARRRSATSSAARPAGTRSTDRTPRASATGRPTSATGRAGAATGRSRRVGTDAGTRRTVPAKSRPPARVDSPPVDDGEEGILRPGMRARRPAPPGRPTVSGGGRRRSVEATESGGPPPAGERPKRPAGRRPPTAGVRQKKAPPKRRRQS